MKELSDKTGGNITGAPEENLPCGFMVTDYCNGTMLSKLSIHKQDVRFEEILAGRAAKLLSSMASLKPPPGTSPGNAGDMSSLVWGFNEFYPPRAFDTLEDLQQFINEFTEVSSSDELLDVFF